MKKYILIFFTTITIFLFTACENSNMISGDKVFTMDKADSLVISSTEEKTITNGEVNGLYNEFKNLKLTETDMVKDIEGGIIITFINGEEKISVRPYGTKIITDDKTYDTDKNVTEIVTKFTDKYAER